MSSYPGQSTLINVTAYDELNHLTAAVFQIDSVESNSSKVYHKYVVMCMIDEWYGTDMQQTSKH